MTELLLRLFIKDDKNMTAPASRAGAGKLAGIVGIVCNSLLFLLKLIVGILSGAVSVIADAMNNLSDAASSVVTLVGFQLAQRPADRDHPFGHARYEYLSGLTVAALILVIGGELAVTSVKRIFVPAAVELTAVTFGVLVCAVAVKLWMSIFFKKLGMRIESTTLKAASVDSRNDVIATAAVLAGCMIEWLLHINVDAYMGLAVAVFILWSGIDMAKQTISPLLGERANTQLTEQISHHILSHEKVLGIHDLLVHDYGPGKCFASVHVELSAQEDPLVCHDIIDGIENDVLDNLNVHLVIHYDPVVTDDAEWNQMRQLTESIISTVDSRLSMHDFRLVRGASQTKLVFDITMPYAMDCSRRELKKMIDAALQENGKDYATVIRFDKD